MPRPPGRLVSVGTHRLHLHCSGEGAPSVIFDAALGASSLSWSLVQPALAGLTRVCVYNRAGFGWSEAGPLPRTAGRIADELHLLLQRAAVPGPYVLVGHSFGGLVVRLFASRHREQVAGVVLIEPAIAEEWVNPAPDKQASIARGATLCRYGRRAARSGLAGVVARLVALGALGPARLLVKLVSRGGLRRADEEILAPIWKLPAEARSVLTHMWTQPKFFEALGSQIETIAESAAEVLRDAKDVGNWPLVVMTAAGASALRTKADQAIAARAERGRHVLIRDCGHWIPLDAPQAVIDVVAGMVREIRASV